MTDQRLSDRLARTVEFASRAGWQCRACGVPIEGQSPGCWAHDIRDAIPDLEALEARVEDAEADLKRLRTALEFHHDGEDCDECRNPSPAAIARAAAEARQETTR